MGKKELVELTVLCLVRKEDEILLQNRVKQDWHGYALPGGHVEPGESIVEAVIREMKEETGLRISHPRLCGIKQFPFDGGRYLVFLFVADRFEGALRGSGEGTVEWVRRDALARLDTVDDLEELLQVMEMDELTEFQYVICDGQWHVRTK